MKKILLLLIVASFYSITTRAQCTITGATVNSSTLSCASLASCSTIYVGNGTNATVLNMNANLDLTCLGAIQFVIRNNASIDFSNGNYDLSFAANTAIIVEAGGNLSAGTNCSASDLIKVGGTKVASCNGSGGGVLMDFPTLVSGGGYNTVNTTGTTICASGSATITAAKNPTPSATTVYEWFTVATGGTPFLTTTVTSSPYSTTYTTPTLSANTTYYVQATTGSVTTLRKAVTVTVTAAPAAPTVTPTSPGCNVANGSITITAPTGAGYTYSTNGTTYTNTTGVFNSMAAGTYSVTAKNSTGCISSSTSVTLSQPSNTWNGTVWSSGTPPTSSQRIVFSGDFSSSSDITGCSCHVTSGNVVFTAGTTLSLVNEVKVTAGSLSFDDTASLVQTNDAAVNSGNITYSRQTSPLKLYDYTYWSSPVAGAALSQLATSSMCYSFSPSINNWVYQANSTAMTPGVGYIGRTPDPLLSATLQTNFVGVPNNGVVNVSIVKSTGAYNLIGNPYPSAIDIDLFLTDATNSTVVNGTIYFWTHNTSITNNNYTINDYAKYNFTGGVRTSTPALSGNIYPTGKIGAGQGFFIEANTAKANGTYTASFKNAMRVTNTNTQFFRNSNTAANSSVSSIEKHRLWLSLTDTQGAYNQMLLGYVTGATNDFDTMFDGKTMPVGNPVAIYTMVGDYDLSIQGKSLPFSENDVIPVAYSTTTNGTLTISLENFDGLFENQNVYMLDKVTGVYHDMKSGDFTFTTTSGTFESRFELHFTNTALGTVVPDFNAAVVVLTNQHQLTVLCEASPIAKLEVFDLSGKQIFSQSGLNTTNFQTGNLSVGTQALLVKITLENDITVIKKTLMN
ncbi:Ig-like domain-containing protein [Flavobacterium phycosphaerae]|uniref:Ig-like domain-containing protein n=1 Tax=Flavobacterium phycosphaerae TaxID=2697515 RepID=UPI00138AEC4A|nr:hypothetical protein [Flavobacterium phycosphaerae]